MEQEYDAVVIGGGHNGLVSAAYLAKEGFKVAVFERRSIVGGAAITEEVWKGFKVSRLSYAYSLFDPQIVKDLRLEQHGLKVVSTDPDLFVPFPTANTRSSGRTRKRPRKGLRNSQGTTPGAISIILSSGKGSANSWVP